MHLRDWAAFVALGLLWGINFLFMREAVHVVQPLQVAWLRVVFGAVPILLFALGRGSVRLADVRHARHFLVMSLLATVVPYVMFAKGTKLLQSGAAGAVSGVIPLMTAAFAILFLEDERLTARKAAGLLAGLVGVAMVARVHRLYGGSSHGAALGAVLMLAGSAGYAGAMVYARRYLAALKIGPLALAAYQTTSAAILLTALAPKSGVLALAGAPRALLALSIGLGLLGTGVAFILYYRLIERLGAITASSVFYLPPVVALVAGACLAGEEVSAIQSLGTVSILAGVFLTRSGAGPRPEGASREREAKRTQADPVRLHQPQDGLASRRPDLRQRAGGGGDQRRPVFDPDQRLALRADRPHGAGKPS